MASSSSGGSGSGSGGTSGGSRPPGSGGYGSGQPPRGGGGAGGSGGQPPFSSSGSGRPTRPTAPAGQERTVSYQREEERYWTDYLRVALPVIGLLLMLGLFWFWAQSLIGDDDDDEPTQIAEVITEPTPIPTEQQPVDLVTTPGGGDAEQTDGGQDAEPTETPTEESDGTTGQQADGQDDGTTDEADPDAGEEADATDAEDPAETADGFQADDIVVVTAEGAPLNMRTDPTTSEENVVEELTEGTELRIVDGPQEAEGYLWYQVANDETAQEGWVVDDIEGVPTIEGA